MSNLNVCIGPEFTTGSLHELKLNGAKPATWPYACGITTENGLCVDSVQGAWVKPYNPNTVFSDQLFTPQSNTYFIQGDTKWYTGTAMTITNPSQCATMAVDFTMIFTGAAPITDSNFAWLELWGGWYLTAPPSSPTTYNIYNSWSGSKTNIWWRTQGTDGGSFTVPAGATQTLYFAVGFHSEAQSGSGNVYSYRVQVNGTSMNV